MYTSDAKRLTTEGARKIKMRPAFASADEFSALIAKEDTELSRLMQTIGLKK